MWRLAAASLRTRGDDIPVHRRHLEKMRHHLDHIRAHRERLYRPFR